MAVKELDPVRTRTSEYDEIEARLKKHFKKVLYEPLAKILRTRTGVKLKNSKGLIAAIQSGKVEYQNGFIKGKFDSALSREIKELGGVWSKSQKGYQLSMTAMPISVQRAVEASLAVYQETVQKLDQQLQKILPEEIADTVSFDDLIDSSMKKIDSDIRGTLKSITVSPELSAEELKRISEGYTQNMRKWIRDWSSEEIEELRIRVQKQALTGKRFGDLAKIIERSYGVSQSKAKFLARQETHLYLAKQKEARYRQAGVGEYKWKTVVGSTNHPVRPAHKALDGKIFSWDDPPITSEPGQAVRRNHPGEDFNCRCYAIPIVRF